MQRKYRFENEVMAEPKYPFPDHFIKLKIEYSQSYAEYIADARRVRLNCCNKTFDFDKA